MPHQTITLQKNLMSHNQQYLQSHDANLLYSADQLILNILKNVIQDCTCQKTWLEMLLTKPLPLSFVYL